MKQATLDILIALATVEFAGDSVDPTGRNAVLKGIRKQVHALPRQELVDAVMTLADRFTRAIEATRAHIELLAITEFEMHPHQVDKLNLPTMLGSLLGLAMPEVREGLCCDTCAFRQGSAANQCLPTVEDALSCAGTPDRFFCHEGVGPDEEPIHVCRGWAQTLKLERSAA